MYPWRGGMCGRLRNLGVILGTSADRGGVLTRNRNQPGGRGDNPSKIRQTTTSGFLGNRNFNLARTFEPGGEGSSRRGNQVGGRHGHSAEVAQGGRSRRMRSDRPWEKNGLSKGATTEEEKERGRDLSQRLSEPKARKNVEKDETKKRKKRERGTLRSHPLWSTL